MMSRAIEISEELWERVVHSAQYRGYRSPQQYVTELLEREVAQAPAIVSDQEVTRKMEELGYLDFGRDI